MVTIIANVISLISCTILVLSGFLKNKKSILISQTIQVSLFAFSNSLLGGITGVITNIVGIIRNILCYKEKYNRIVKLVIIAFTICFSIVFNNLGIIGYVPVVATVIYTYFLDTKNIINFKLLIIFNMALWCFYDFYIGGYVAGIFDALTVVTNAISIVKIKLDSKGKCLNVTKGRCLKCINRNEI